MCIIIGDVYQFISHCLIPLDPCKKTELEDLLYFAAASAVHLFAAEFGPITGKLCLMVASHWLLTFTSRIFY